MMLLMAVKFKPIIRRVAQSGKARAGRLTTRPGRKAARANVAEIDRVAFCFDVLYNPARSIKLE